MADSTTLETKFCSNCKREINATNFMMHEMHCRRHISLCTHCQEPIPKAEMEIHFEESHAKINCGKCNQAVEKMYLEEHEEQECPKRQMKCAYCEMDVAQQDLETHLGYCGTRTEPCARCGQYIMIKDQVKHEDSNCTYPQPKLTNSKEVNRQMSNSNGATSNGEGASAAFSDDMLFGSGNMNSFEFKEIQRILTKPEISGAAEGSSVHRSRSEAVKTKKATGKKSNDKNKKSDLNRLREQSSSGQSAMGPIYNEEQDRLLAMALSDDLHSADGIDQYIRTIDKPRVSLTPDSPLYEDGFGNPANLHSSFGDLSVLPCEFCGQAIPVDDLVIHQSNCIEDPLSSLMPHAASSESPIHERTEDNRYRGTAPESRQPPPIINNLVPESSAPQQQWFEQMISPEEDFAEDFLLPCEFCEELFPHEILVQHQAVCNANETVTPRVTPSSTSRNIDPSNRHLPTVDEPSRVRKRQPAPDIASILSESPDNRRRQAGTSSRTSSNHIPKHSQQLKSTMERYGVAADDTYQKRAERRALRHQNSHEDEEDVTPRPRTGKSVGRRNLGTKSTLDSLLQVDPTNSVRPSHDLLGHVTQTSSTRKTSKDNLNSSRQTRPLGGPSVPSHSVRTSQKYDVNTSSLYGNTSRTSRGNDAAAPSRRPKEPLTARDVQNELDLIPGNRSTLGISGTTGSRRARNSQASEDLAASSIRTTSTTPGSARRDRGNGIFSHGQATSSSSTNTRSTRAPTRARRDRDPYH
ncbi:TRAF-type zinc finger domain-containing protein 1-like [Ylistrum balloti]|uniref:TRAF-type zinc finger domain-containing protein 1-like n=1 Tax=Ylistrum balloti TaxID=509963 RepID=UPI002905F683|nr:TRAF-type zinc finger domain-containing protein 1-like [Ylistrum balloti]XP_060069443.1 TRAF-type zinc finger domain-containing protein 1-like [Ylistrum balloti]